VKGEPDDFWGKLDQDEQGRVLEWNPVEAHCADVAASAEALLRDTSLGMRMAHLTGRRSLHPILLARLVVLAALHDLGKYAISFQNRPYPDRKPQGGHVEPIVKALSFGGRLTERLIAMLSPLEVFGSEWASFLAASISHHGRPEKIGASDGDSTGFDPSVFEPSRGLDPLSGMQRLIDFTRVWCPEAFEPGPPEAELPEPASVGHFFAGIVMLADWLGSDKSVFAFVDDREDPMPRARKRAAEIVRARFLAIDALRSRCRTDYGVFDSPDRRFIPRPAQEVVDALPLPSDERATLTVLEAETGSGKTEAAIHRFAQLFSAGAVDGLFFALPTRTSATQIHRRVVDAVASTFSSLPKEERPPVVLAVPGYLRVDDDTGTALPDFKFLWPDQGKDRHRTWAAENTKRYLAGSVVVGTIDQVLLSTLVVAHAHLRATALSRLLLVVDEVHASDAYMTALLDQVLAFHFACGGHAFLMSATLGTTTQERFFARLRLVDPLGVMPKRSPRALGAACEVPYPAVHHATANEVVTTFPALTPGNPKECATELWSAIDEPGDVARRALSAARLGAQVLVLRNTVADAVETQEAIEMLATEADAPLLFSIGDVVTLHHARFVDSDRKKLDEAVERRIGKHAPRTRGSVIVATQTVQQSLDLDADLLITDLCPMDVLLQRIGRLHRHLRAEHERPEAFRVARCAVLDPGPLAELVGESGEVKGKHGFGKVYPDLRILEATRALLLEQPMLAIPADNRSLVERTTHPDALAAVVAVSGRNFERHAMQAEASTTVQRQLAGGHVVERKKPMGTYGFPSRETSGRITTRLGEEDRVVEFETAFESPFGTKVRRVKIPHWLAPGWPSGISGRVLRVTERSTLFDVHDDEGKVLERFVYDRLGLRTESSVVTELVEENADE
jgi:CRISPR-associated endonuclease/helicase Cas3